MANQKIANPEDVLVIQFERDMLRMLNSALMRALGDGQFVGVTSGDAVLDRVIPLIGTTSQRPEGDPEYWDAVTRSAKDRLIDYLVMIGRKE